VVPFMSQIVSWSVAAPQDVGLAVAVEVADPQAQLGGRQ